MEGATVMTPDVPTKHTRLPAKTLLVLGVLALAGCGPAEGTISGTVQFDGRPLTAGVNTVTFLGDDGGVKSCMVEPDGRYSLRGVRVGHARITVQSLPSPPHLSMAPGEDGQMKPVGESDQLAKPGRAPGIPERYKDPSKSGLSHDVQRGSHTFDIILSP
jgi:hypothetical protein